jgi:hypothetical protein
LINVSNPKVLTVINSIPIENAMDILIDGELAYIID